MSIPSAQVRDPETYAIIGAAMEVHSILGDGLLEAAYKDALEIEFELRGIPYQREVELPIVYKGRRLACRYRADFICYGNIIVECKAIKNLSNVDRSQLIHYLKATGYKRGLLLNFGAATLEYERMVN